ncbi:class I SAM-dependent methyltransferase [Patulibacter sp. SYSU D01012]|uniref:class I SAM-dependent methyltransferase n=1 Tax=Patulibacter sp. SYSU D01012 TaxID=2817381 RepID=UPI001B30171C|nr:class I SAM-dependent methyltransferase [Patulibacter sp. SYSU D01012]
MTVDLGEYETDKTSDYLERYRLEFGHLFEQPIRMLELGVQRGGSMYLWRDLLPTAQIAGLDLNPIRLEDESGRLHLYQGFQQDTAVLDRIAADVAPDGFDVIIDDASHVGAYTEVSFWHMFRHHLKPGGIYVLDDWGSGYWSDWTDGHAYTGTREALGDRGNESAEVPSGPSVSRVERARRSLRRSARPLAARLPPAIRQGLERTYMAMEGATMRRRFKSHDYGMVGFVKQLVDACGVHDIDRGRGPFNNGIETVHVYPSQVFVHKAAPTS